MKSIVNFLIAAFALIYLAVMAFFPELMKNMAVLVTIIVSAVILLSLKYYLRNR